jgi:tetrahydromethanopterin S-methyltransferase subunit G
MSELILEKVYNVKNINTRVEDVANKIYEKKIDRQELLVILYGLVVGIEAEIIKSKNKKP